MAPPPHALGTHHGGGSRPGFGEELVDGVAELLGLHVVGVPAESGDAQRAVGRIGPRSSPPAQAWLPPVRDAGVGQPLLHRLPTELRMAAARRKGPHVDDEPDARVGHQRREVILRERAVPDGAEVYQ
jgi:hypothetical protein